MNLYPSLNSKPVPHPSISLRYLTILGGGGLGVTAFGLSGSCTILTVWSFGSSHHDDVVHVASPEIDRYVTLDSSSSASTVKYLSWICCLTADRRSCAAFTASNARLTVTVSSADSAITLAPCANSGAANKSNAIANVFILFLLFELERRFNNDAPARER